MAFLLAGSPTLVGLFSDMNAPQPGAQAWRALSDGFRDIYVSGMHLNEYRRANTYWWQQLRQMLEAVGLTPVQAADELAVLQDAIHQFGFRLVPPADAFVGVPAVRRHRDLVNLALDDTESDDDLDAAMDEWMQGADVGMHGAL